MTSDTYTMTSGRITHRTFRESFSLTSQSGTLSTRVTDQISPSSWGTTLGNGMRFIERLDGSVNVLGKDNKALFTIERNGRIIRQSDDWQNF